MRLCYGFGGPLPRPQWFQCYREDLADRAERSDAYDPGWMLDTLGWLFDMD